MRLLPFTILIALIACACSGGEEPKPLCDDPCLKDTLKFIEKDHPLEPYVFLSAKNCVIDTITLSYKGMGINRKYAFADYFSSGIKLDKDLVYCHVKDTSNAWLLFNNCENGRGYSLKIPFDRKKTINRRSNAINNFDPKYAVADGLAAYTDRGNIFVEEMSTGKKAMMTFGKEIQMDYDYMHDAIDSVNISHDRIWARVKIDKNWEIKEKNITLQ